MGKKTSKKTKTKKGGAGKFFLGALIGAAAGAIASRLTEEPKTCNCEKPTAKKPAAKKKTATKKATAKKSTTKKTK